MSCIGAVVQWRGCIDPCLLLTVLLTIWVIFRNELDPGCVAKSPLASWQHLANRSDSDF